MAVEPENHGKGKGIYLSMTGRKILQHWEKYRPNMVKRLRREGRLLSLVYQTQESVIQALHQLETIQGLPVDQAQEIVRPMWCLPDEETSPDLAASGTPSDPLTPGTIA